VQKVFFESKTDLFRGFAAPASQGSGNCRQTASERRFALASSLLKRRTSWGPMCELSS